MKSAATIAIVGVLGIIDVALITLKVMCRILQLHTAGQSYKGIVSTLREDYDVTVSRQAVSRFIRYYEQSRRLVRKPGSGR